MFGDFFKNYFSLGISCIFASKGWKENRDGQIRDLDYCGYGYLWILGYVLSLFVLQACLTTVTFH